MEEKQIHKFSELDFSNVAAARLSEIINLLNQRLARIEDVTYMRDGAGHLITDENGEPLSLTKQYLLEAMKALDEQKNASNTDNTDKTADAAE